MNWPEAEVAIRTQIETQWAVGAYADMKLIWENENQDVGDRYMAVDIEGAYSEKTIYGSAGKRSSIEGGVVYFHAFTPIGKAKSLALSAVQAMSEILELTVLGNGAIRLEGANPPSPVESRTDRDYEIARGQPGGMYYRCSGSVPFIVIGVR